MRRNTMGFKFVVLFMFLLIAAPRLVAAPNVLFIVNDSQIASLGQHDLFIQSELNALGANITLMTGTASTAADATGKDLVIISESIGSGTVAGKFKSVSVPVLTDEAFIFDDMALTSVTANTHFGTVVTSTTIDILQPAHPLAGGLSGSIQVYGSPGTISFGVPAAGAVKVAGLSGNSSRAAIFAYEAGDTLIDGTTTPARRVGFFWHSDGGSATGWPLSTDGITLFRAAMDWASGGTVPVELSHFNTE